jgi:FlaA1/EpsC-like NDP-sugar epimerase
MNEDLILKLLDRKKLFFQNDFDNNKDLLQEKIKNSRIIVLGGAGSIGSATVNLLCSFNPLLLHVVDIDENGLVELVRNIRSSIGYTSGGFETFAIDIGSTEFSNLVINNNGYDIWMNFAALKHVRSEKDPYTLMRLLEVNIMNTYKSLKIAIDTGAKKYFSVSTDKASNPINFMGASKRAMELVLGAHSNILNTSSARFGNVAFSNGSLLQGTIKRYENYQPFVAPLDIKRYFLTPLEASKLSILSTFLGENGEVFIPILKKNIAQKDFPSILKNFLRVKGLEMHVCGTEEEARNKVNFLYKNNKWPCYLFKTDTTGEKLEEVFVSNNEILKDNRYDEIEIIDISDIKNSKEIKSFINSIEELKKKPSWTIEDIKIVMEVFLKNFKHKNTGKHLDSKM